MIIIPILVLFWHCAAAYVSSTFNIWEIWLLLLNGEKKNISQNKVSKKCIFGICNVEHQPAKGLHKTDTVISY